MRMASNVVSARSVYTSCLFLTSGYSIKLETKRENKPYLSLGLRILELRMQKFLNCAKELVCSPVILYVTIISGFACMYQYI